MKEYNCKATSTWSKCGRAKETAFVHKQVEEKKQEVTSQLDCIVGPRRDDDVNMCNDVRDVGNVGPLSCICQDTGGGEN